MMNKKKSKGISNMHCSCFRPLLYSLPETSPCITDGGCKRRSRRPGKVREAKEAPADSTAKKKYLWLQNRCLNIRVMFEIPSRKREISGKCLRRGR